jgi:hypothetical protein
LIFLNVSETFSIPDLIFLTAVAADFKMLLPVMSNQFSLIDDNLEKIKK